VCIRAWDWASLIRRHLFEDSIDDYEKKQSALRLHAQLIRRTSTSIAVKKEIEIDRDDLDSSINFDSSTLFFSEPR
jgi:hypothetical protein